MITYVAGRKSCLVYTTVVGTQTWERAGGSWMQLEDTGPATIGGLVYDEARGRAVGIAMPKTGSLETWEWDGSAWTVVADTGPPTRQGFALTYDAQRNSLCSSEVFSRTLRPRSVIPGPGMAPTGNRLRTWVHRRE
jgi:hypothetical protein